MANSAKPRTIEIIRLNDLINTLTTGTEKRLQQLRKFAEPEEETFNTRGAERTGRASAVVAFLEMV